MSHVAAISKEPIRINMICVGDPLYDINKTLAHFRESTKLRPKTDDKCRVALGINDIKRFLAEDPTINTILFYLPIETTERLLEAHNDVLTKKGLLLVYNVTDLESLPNSLQSGLKCAPYNIFKRGLGKLPEFIEGELRKHSRELGS